MSFETRAMDKLQRKRLCICILQAASRRNVAGNGVSPEQYLGFANLPFLGDGFLRIAKVEHTAISCPGIGACFQWAPMDVDTCRLCVGTRGLTLRLTRTESTAVELEQFVLMFATALFFNISKISLKSV